MVDERKRMSGSWSLKIPIYEKYLLHPAAAARSFVAVHWVRWIHRRLSSFLAAPLFSSLVGPFFLHRFYFCRRPLSSSTSPADLHCAPPFIRSARYGVYDACRRYLGERKQFGVALAVTFQLNILLMQYHVSLWSSTDREAASVWSITGRLPWREEARQDAGQHSGHVASRLAPLQAARFQQHLVSWFPFWFARQQTQNRTLPLWSILRPNKN